MIAPTPESEPFQDLTSQLDEAFHSLRVPCKHVGVEEELDLVRDALIASRRLAHEYRVSWKGSAATLQGIIDRMTVEIRELQSALTVREDELKGMDGMLKDQAAQLTDYQRMLGNRREQRFLDATPDETMPIRILEAYIEHGDAVSSPPAIGELMNQWQAERNAILRQAIEKLAQPKPISS